MKDWYRICFLLIIGIYFSCNENHNGNQIAFSKNEIQIDGNPSDVSWQKVEWRQMNHKWLGPDIPKEDFQGKFKLLWDEDHLYVLAEIVDDTLIDINEDGLEFYWNDDCFEVFVDEDASGGEHTFNYNAFAYHLSLDNKVVDIGRDSIPHYYDHVKYVRKTEGNTSIWELSIDIYDDEYDMTPSYPKMKLSEHKEMGIAIAYCDNDHSEEREHFFGSMHIDGEDKNRTWKDASLFEKFVLAK